MIPTPRLTGRSLCLGLGVLTVIASSAACAKHTTKPSLNLVWQDEFSGPAGQLPDSSRWTFDVGTDWGNGQIEYDTSRPENVSLDGVGDVISREPVVHRQDRVDPVRWIHGLVGHHTPGSLSDAVSDR